MPSKFINIDPDQPACEDVQQAYAVQQLRRLGYLVHADSNGAHKSLASASKQKILGSHRGWPDLTIVIPHKIVFCELKVVGGIVSPHQKATHLKMQKKGHSVEIVFSRTPRECFEKILHFLVDPHMTPCHS